MVSLVAPRIERLQPYQPGTPMEEVARRHGLSSGDIARLASNENPLGPSPLAIAAVQRELGAVHRYPESEAPSLRAALAHRLRVTPEEVVVGSGSSELIELMIRTFCTDSEHVVFSEPAFALYRIACLTHGVPHTAVPVTAYQHDLVAMGRAVTPRTRLIFIDNPNNPVGTHVGHAGLSEFLAAIPPEVIVVLDEAYCEYAEAADYPDGLKLRDRHPRIVVARTFSKIYGLAGLRLGYAVMPVELATYVHRVRPPFNVNSVAQAAGLAALEDTAHVERSRALNSSEKAFMRGGLEALGLKAIPSEANFVLVDVGRPAFPIYEALVTRGVIVRAIPPLPRMLRITLGTREENERCLLGLRAVLG